MQAERYLLPSATCRSRFVFVLPTCIFVGSDPTPHFEP